MSNDYEPKLLLPFLKPLYDVLIPLSWPLVRCASGVILAVHGLRKIERGAQVGAPPFAEMGYGHPVAVYYFLLSIELIGGIAISLGLFTRFFAAAITIEMAIIVFVNYLPNGFSWLNRGYEYPLMWMLITLAIWWRGGGPWSLDRKIGTEL